MRYNYGVSAQIDAKPGSVLRIIRWVARSEVVCLARCIRALWRPLFSSSIAHRHRRNACARAATVSQPNTDSHPARGRPALAKILIVDDDIAVQATIKLLLERAGHSIVVAGDGREGLATLGTGDFDLLFLDIFMPGMDGLETMRMIHQQQPLIPIIVISGRPIALDAGSAPDFLTMATKLGAVSSLQKPFKPSALLAAVTRCLEAARQPSTSSIAAGEAASRP